MSNIYEFHLKPYWAYTFDQEDILYIHKKASEYCGVDADISVTYKNGIILKSDNPLSVIDDPTSYVNYIDSIFIYASKYSSEETSKSVSVSIQTSNIIQAVRIRASGPRNNCAVFRSDIESFLSSKKEWYSFLYYSYILSSIFACIIGYIFHIIIGKSGIYEISSNINSALMTAFFVFIFMIITNNIYRRLSLNIGRNLKSNKLIKSVFYFILLAVILNLLTGVGGNFIYDFIKTYTERK